MSLDQPITRRTALAAGAAGVGVVALGACGSDDSPPAAKEPEASTPATQAPAGAAPIAALSDVPVGGAISAKGGDGKPIIVAQPTAGQVVAFTAICTHMGCTVAPSGKDLNCPCHGSKYNALTGAVVNGPAPRPLAKVDVKVESGQVVAS
jgi:cytochrome b6-f complex iron-sulfur subunit